MHHIINLDSVKQALDTIGLESLINGQEQAFVAYAQNKALVPPVGHIYFDQPRGDCHIKYGHLLNENFFVVKIATTFYENIAHNLPSGNGLMVLLCRQTGVPKAIILDEGYLTDIRTALAGVIVARYLAPHHISKIGILGTGVQARLQLEFLKDFTSCKDVVIWGRDLKRLALYKAEMQPKGFNIQTTQNITDVTSMCNFIITTTASKIPLLMAAQIQPGTHITAVGADGRGKQELEAELFQKADICVVDSLPQCADFGDTSYALKKSLIKSNKLIELGKVIQNPTHQRTHDQQITIADLTGVAVQDIEIANQVYRDRRLLV